MQRRLGADSSARPHRRQRRPLRLRPARGPAPRVRAGLQPGPGRECRARPRQTTTPGGGAHLGHGHLRLQAGARPRAVLSRRPRLTCGLSSRVSSMGSLSIPGIVAKAGRRQDTRQPPTAPRAAPPVAADPVRPLAGAAAPAQSSAATAREIPPPLGPLTPPPAHPLARCNVYHRYGGWPGIPPRPRVLYGAVAS